MIASPFKGQMVKIRYADKKQADLPMPHQNKTGIVFIASKSKPRNHLVFVGAAAVIVPCGNLQIMRKNEETK